MRSFAVDLAPSSQFTVRLTNLAPGELRMLARSHELKMIFLVKADLFQFDLRDLTVK